MASSVYDRVLQEVQQLSPEEQLRVIARVAERLSSERLPGNGAPRWEDYAGSASYPLCGQDAQEWVTRTRRESDDVRSRP